MGAPRRFYWDGGKAVRTFFRCRFCRFLFFSFEVIHTPNEQKNTKRHDYKAHNGIDEHTIVDGHRARRLGVG